MEKKYEVSSSRLCSIYRREMRRGSGSPMSGAHQSMNACVTPLPRSLMNASGSVF